jgi:hypothetical protein
MSKKFTDLKPHSSIQTTEHHPKPGEKEPAFEGAHYDESKDQERFEANRTKLDVARDAFFEEKGTTAIGVPMKHAGQRREREHVEEKVLPVPPATRDDANAAPGAKLAEGEAAKKKLKEEEVIPTTLEQDVRATVEARQDQTVETAAAGVADVAPFPEARAKELAAGDQALPRVGQQPPPVTVASPPSLQTANEEELKKATKKIPPQ